MIPGLAAPTTTNAAKIGTTIATTATTSATITANDSPTAATRSV
jgi:hypothetical protein